MKAVAIIPARGGSKRLPRKNILPLAGKPMISYPIKTALASGLFESVIVSTEDTEISEIAREYGAQVISRPPEFSTDEAHELDACLHVLDTLKDEGSEPEAFCVLYPTAAFLIADDLIHSMERLNQKPAADVVMGVSAYDIHPYKALVTSPEGYLEPMFPKECRMRSQFYPHLMASNGTFCWLRTSAFHDNPTYYTKRLKPYEMPLDRAVDIDTKEDYERAQRLFAISKKS